MNLNYLLLPLLITAAVPTTACTVSARPATEVAYVDAEPPPPPAPRAHYVRGHWEHRGRTTVWVDGHWV